MDMSTEKRQLLRRYSFIKKLSGKIYYLATLCCVTAMRS